MIYCESMRISSLNIWLWKENSLSRLKRRVWETLNCDSYKSLYWLDYVCLQSNCRKHPMDGDIYFWTLLQLKCNPTHHLMLLLLFCAKQLYCICSSDTVVSWHSDQYHVPLVLIELYWLNISDLKLHASCSYVSSWLEVVGRTP